MDNIPPTASHTTLSEHEVRVAKVKALHEEGERVWPEAVAPQHTAAQMHQEYTPENKNEYTLAGRVMTKREHGKTMFCTVQDASGIIQIYVKKDILGADSFDRFFHFIDSGDYIFCRGTLFKTMRGEITLQVNEWKLLTKCLHALPEKFHGLHDVEIRYRQRYLDLMTNQETRHRFIARSKIVSAMRAYLERNGFLEVETPMLHPIPGGAAARPFVTHHNTLDQDLFLRIAPELYLKRLVVGGLERVYEINRSFRNEGVSTRHNPEFTMLEFYMAHHDYRFAMEFVEQLFKELVAIEYPTLQVPFGPHTLDFSKPFERINAYQALIKYAGFTDEQLAPARIDQTAAEHKVAYKADTSYGQKVFLLFEECAEKHLIQPTYLIDFPVEISPLAKRDAHDPEVAARYELFIAGMELSNGYNELNDPFDQAERFKAQAEAHKAGNEEAMHYDADYVHALEYGLPPTVGVGIGIDRLVMLLTNTLSIKDVILFPALKRK